MHHRPSGPPLSARLAGVVTQLSLLLRGRLGRLAGAALLTTTVVGLVLAIPVVSGAGGVAPSVTLDAASSSAADDERSSPVVMGLDGRPLPATASSQNPGAAPPSTPSSSSSAEGPPETASEPDTTGSATTPSSSEGTTSAPSSSTSSPSSSRTPSPPGTTAPGTSTPDSTTDAPVPPATPDEEAPAQPSELSGAPAEALALVNAARTDAGCADLAADSALTTAAEAHSAEMSASGVAGLDGLVGAVAQGRPNAQSAVSGWLGDPTDSAALLDCSKTSAGVGVVDGWWTFLLA